MSFTHLWMATLAIPKLLLDHKDYHKISFMTLHGAFTYIKIPLRTLEYLWKPSKSNTNTFMQPINFF